ncbi:DUF1697 domain-containing protein [Devosia aquimaris]|uniref:DUF1697 domain-containing protein n=1 Tax=Devosia aquimaris TaxID=2866214 RepID=UPI001CD17924|nr:DUF1697 domain-containing protein [Devosia sp. CJK-A8-3]
MAVWCGFLRGVNLGKRQMKMAELKACLETAGLGAVKTFLASGNVRFEAEGNEADVRHRIEAAMEKSFAFPVRAVVRSADALAAMVAAAPFAGLDPDADLTRHVLLSDRPFPESCALEGRPKDTEIVRMDDRELYLATYRQANGRYTEHVEEVLKPLYAAVGKDWLDTMRNWNTIEKILQ